MALPSWVAEQQLRVNALKRQSVAPIPMGVMADSPLTAPGWKELNIEYTCVPDAMYPWDPAILKKINEFDPGATPLWVRWTFLSPDNTEVVTFGRHAIGRYKSTLTVDVPQIKVKGMPKNAKFKKPNLIEFTWMDQPDGDLPGKYRAFDSRLLAHCRRNYSVKSSNQMKREMHAEIDYRKQQAVQREIEQEYRQRELDKYTAKKLAQMSEVEMKEVFSKLQHRERPKKVYV